MKKIFLGLLVAASSLTFAQQVGLKAGLNISDVSKVSNTVNTKSKTGLYAGVTLHVPITEEYSIQPELIYNQLGAKSDAYSIPVLGNVSADIKLDYISLPIMLQYNLPSNLYLEVGPEFSYMVDAKATAFTILSPTFNVNMDYLNRFNVGGAIGAGYNLNKNISVNARYTLGLTGIGKNGSVTNYFLDNAKNNNIQVGLGFKF